MTPCFHKLLCAALPFLLCKWAFSQAPSFYHLTTANGLYDNRVRSLAIDKRGFLWVGTEESLNVYDGRSITTYLKEKNPALPSDYVTQLYCDAQNRIWIGTAQGVAWMDGRRIIYRVRLQDSIQDFATKAIFETKAHEVVLVTNKGQYGLTAQNRWQPIKEATTALPFPQIKAVQAYDEHSALFVTDSVLLLYDYTQNRLAKQYRTTGVTGLCKRKDGTVALGKTAGQIIVMNPENGRTVRAYFLRINTEDKHALVRPGEMKEAVNGDLIVATGLDGLFTIKPNGIISRFIHDPVVPTSLLSNSAYRIATGTNGEVVVGTSTSGVSIYNTHLTQAAFKGFFADAAGDYYDNYTGQLKEDGKGVVWIATYDRLIRWDPKNAVSHFYAYKEGGKGRAEGPTALCTDKGGLWAGLGDKGLFFFSEASHRFTKLKPDAALPQFNGSTVNDILKDRQGTIWVCTGKGVYTVNAIIKKASPVENDLQGLTGRIVQSAFEDSKGRLWFAVIHDGVYCFDKAGHQRFHFTVKDGLPSNICYMVREDKRGRFFITTAKGLGVLNANGSLTSLTRQNGLRYERCESVLIDDEDHVWFSNRQCLVKLNADDNTLQIFDEKAGLLNDGFRVGSCLKSNGGELLWGGYRGVSHFRPEALLHEKLPLRVSVYAAQVQDSAMDITANHPLRITYASNDVTFRFAGVHLGIPGKTFFQYRLQGFDAGWQKGEDLPQARYAALPPGDYVFEAKGTLDGVHWVHADKNVRFTVVPPLWRRWWFVVLSASLFAAAVYWLVQTRNKKLKEHKEELEAEQAVNYFASSLHEQQTVEAILWDVARNCIGRLGFEDCVVYLLDEQRNALVQKAAYGPKSPKGFQIAEPLEIPVGKGIVGSVAQSGKAEIIADTTKDNRYIVDDERRLSEIAVPFIWNGKVIGVIDCEHGKKGYFTQKHLSILITIASLCANKIVRAQAEEEAQKAKATLSDTKQKMAEVEMQALRAQMNPHFIFNCLNSINRYIVKSDGATASLYLTRFAKLIRLILDNSGNKNVPLSNELEALKLYIEMEALRFDKKFSYQIDVDKSIDTDGIALPPLIIQPYVENAIWHGLLHKDGGGQLTVRVALLDEGMLECVVEDNGVGRAKARELKSKSATSRKSLGMQLTESRLALLNRHAELSASIAILDVHDERAQPAGTKVILHIPV